MTANQVFEEVGLVVPHPYENELLLIWLNRLERFASVEVEGLACDAIADITQSKLNTKLRIPDPYSVVYPLYLQCMIHLAMGEYDRYTALYRTFNNSFSDYAKWYVRKGR